MNRLASNVLCTVLGFGAALAVLPVAQSAPSSVLSAYRELDIFGQAFERVRANYVRPVEDSELISAAINGMVSALDPHSRYLTAKEMTELQSDTRGEYDGVGAEITMEDGAVKVVSAIDDTPAARAGLKPGDYIFSIDGSSLHGLSLDEATNKLRGPSGTKVTLTVVRKGARQPLTVTLTRALIPIVNVRWHREGNVGYIRIAHFINEKTDAQVQRAITELKRQIGPQLKGYVLDLRNNPGGLVDQSVGVSDDFLSGGEVVSTRGRRPEENQRYNARSGDLTDGKPLVVLINEGSASASEIVAGALQDHHRATVVGMTSFGKGSVQSIIPMSSSGGALWLTTARYYTPSGRSIQAAGIVPDIAVSQLAAKDDVNVSLFPSEAQLPGHLDAEGQHRPVAATIVRPAAGKTYADFQLSYALDRLNGRNGTVLAGQDSGTQTR